MSKRLRKSTLCQISTLPVSGSLRQKTGRLTNRPFQIDVTLVIVPTLARVHVESKRLIKIDSSAAKRS